MPAVIAPWSDSWNATRTAADLIIRERNMRFAEFVREAGPFRQSYDTVYSWIRVGAIPSDETAVNLISAWIKKNRKRKRAKDTLVAVLSKER